MLRLQKYLKKAKTDAWESFKDAVYPKRLRRPYNRYMRDTKPYYPWSPGFSNEYTPKNKELVQTDFRTPYKDAS